MFAVTPLGEGNAPGYRAIDKGWVLENGETFTVDEKPEGKVLDSDLSTFIDETQSHITARKTVQDVKHLDTILNIDARSDDMSSRLIMLLITEIAGLKSITVEQFKNELRTLLT